MAFQIPARYELRKKHQMSKEACEAIVLKTLQQLEWIEIGYLKDAFDYRSRGTMLTFAERIKVYVGPTEILVKSECLFPGQFLDFGKNKKNIIDFFKIFDQLK